MRPPMERYNKKVIKKLCAVQPAKRQAFADQVLGNLTENEVYDCSTVKIATLQNTSVCPHKDLSALKSQLKDVFWGPQWLGIEDILRNIPEKEQEQFSYDTLSLTRLRKKEIILQVAFLLSKIGDQQQRSNFVNLVEQKFYYSLNDFRDSNYPQALSILASIPYQDLPAFANQFWDIYG